MSGVHAASIAPSFYQRHRKGVILASVLIVLMLAGTAAWAAWLVYANGNGSARSGAAPVAPSIQTITPATLTQGAIMPGETGPLQVKIDNPNAFPLYLKQVDVLSAAQNPSNVYDGNSGSDVGVLCPVSNWELVDRSALSIAVAPGVSTVNVPNAVTLKASAPIGCANTVARFQVNGNDQGFTFDITP